MTVPESSTEEPSLTVPQNQHFWQIADPAVALGLLEVRTFGV